MRGEIQNEEWREITTEEFREVQLGVERYRLRSGEIQTEQRRDTD